MADTKQTTATTRAGDPSREGAPPQAQRAAEPTPSSSESPCTSDGDNAGNRTGDHLAGTPSPTALAGGSGGGETGPPPGSGGGGDRGPGRGGKGRGSGAAGSSRKGGGGKHSGPRGVGNGKPAVRSVPPVMLLLAGVPGSGKSTFSRNLLQASPVAWVHVSQDAISNGRPGSRQQCLTAVRAALDEGACCVVDRCHSDAEQRASFLQLAAERGLAAHCVTLQPPLELCARRVAGRTDHPGGVQGDASKRVVYQMAKQQQTGQGWPPPPAEGFQSVMDCHNDADAEAAVQAWAVYGSDTAPLEAAVGPGATGAAVTAVGAAATADAGPVAAPAGAMAKAAAAEAEAATLAIWQAHAAKRKTAPAGILSFFKPAKDNKAGGAAATGTSGTTPSKAPATAAVTPRAEAKSAPAVPSLVPPAQSTAAAGSGAAGTARAPAGTGTKKAGDKRPAPAGDGAEADLGGRAVKRATVSAPQSTAASGGGGGSSGIGGSREASQREGKGPPKEAQPGVQQNGGDEHASRQGRRGGDAGGSGAPSSGGRNAFSVLMASASHKPTEAHGRGAHLGTAAGGGRGGRATEADASEARDPRFRLGSPWQQHLRTAALDPEHSQQRVLYVDEKAVMIADAFPKARHHALVLARDPRLRSIADLRKQDLPLLEHMQQVAVDWIQKERAEHPDAAAFKLGFHAVPSMCQLHMHVVSQDFDSPSLKNKKHWNSFTTRFFLAPDAVRRDLEEHGRVSLVTPEEEKQLEGQDLQCHGCAKPLRNIPELKKHIVSCDQVKQLPGL